MIYSIKTDKTENVIDTKKIGCMWIPPDRKKIIYILIIASCGIEIECQNEDDAKKHFEQILFIMRREEAIYEENEKIRVAASEAAEEYKEFLKNYFFKPETRKEQPS
jgi:hypothetical protein